MFVSLIIMQSLDGFIARNLQDDLSWGSKEDKQFFRTKTKEVGCMIMGSTTFENMPFPLAFQNRFSYVMTSNPSKYKHFEESGLVKFVSGSGLEVLEKIRQDGYQKVVVIGGGKINSAFLSENLIDELFITISPHIFGQGVPAFGENLLNVSCKLESFQQITANEIVCHYSVLK